LSKKIIFFSIIAIGIIGFVIYRFVNLGAFHLVNEDPELSTTVDTLCSLPGIEDFEIDSGKYLYGISFDRRKWESDPSTNGVIIFINLQDSVQKIITTELKAFHPHGISLLKSDTSNRLFIVNHMSKDEHSVEVFKIHRYDSVSHHKTIKHKLIDAPNDIVATDTMEFYLTNSSKAFSGILRKLDAFLDLKLGNIIHYKNGTADYAIKNLSFPNGIILDDLSSCLFFSETISGNLSAYSVDSHGVVRFLDEINLGQGLDNISIDQSGDLWVSQSPNLIKYGSHIRSSTKSPFIIHKVKFSYPSFHSEAVMLENNGSILSGVSVVNQFKNKLIIGSLMDEGLVNIQIPDRLQ